MSAKTTTTDIFSAVISDIKSYSGNDPLLPWLRGVRKLRETLSPELLQEKLPRFLQKCAQSFDTDRRYRNDLRYLRIWLQLMDYVDDTRALLRNMETKKIGTKRALFYQAYALYYEKLKKFDGADQMYRLGVQNLAEPLDELQKSYEQFLQRMQRHKNKRVQREEKKKNSRRPLSDRKTTDPICSFKENDENSCKVDENPEKSLLKEYSLGAGGSSKSKLTAFDQNLMPQSEMDLIGRSKLCRNDSVVSKFADSAIDGRSEAEDARHHGLVEPTINTKEALNAINDMFREPIEPSNAVSRSSKSRPNVNQSTSNVFKVFVDENSESAVRSSRQQDDEKHTNQSLHEPLNIYVDDESSNDSVPSESQTSTDGSPSSSNVDAFVFLRPNDDHHSESSNDMKLEKSSKKARTNFREDTVVRRFVGSAILDEPEVEDICHHGLVDPTINLKEAMEDINGMFGKPIDFVRTTRRKRQENAVASGKNDYGGFSILPDDEFNAHEGKQPPESSSTKNKDELYEPTVFTKQAMDDINDLFRMPLDF
ncbi:hypothetical protein vseg_006676 [Gypsophila vaccaria]